jgi:hypothetical protein
MTDRDLSPAVWRKSSRSGSTGGECVEVAWLGFSRGMPDSRTPEADSAVSR